MDAFHSLADVIRVQSKNRKDAVAFDFEGRLTTFGELDVRSSQTAQGLVTLGVRPQEHIGYIGKNSDLYFEILLGAAKAGAVMTPVNWRLAGPEIAYILNDAHVKVLFVGPEFVDLIHAIRSDLDPDLKIFLVDPQRADWPDYALWRDAQETEDPRIPSAREDPVLQMYTSGTTGRPKGAMLANRGILGLRGLDGGPSFEWNTWTEDDISLVAMPCFHIGGTGWGIMGLYNGAKGIVMREFDPLLVLGYIEVYRITKIFMVPAAMQIVVSQPKARSVDFSCLKYILYGASPIPLDLLRTCMEVFGCGFVQMYGMTETSGTIVALPPEDHDPQGNERMRSAGKPMPGVEVAILDAQGHRLPPREVGEIATRSVANMVGYWNLPEATAETLSQDGWLRTGDAGYMDEDGYVYIHDRVKDMIISGGENIYPAEVENAIFGHPDVADVAVVGVPSEKWGEEVLAIVVPREGTAPTSDDIIAFARTRIAGYKCPKAVSFIDSLPRNPSGKILRRELRAPYWEDQDRNVS